MKRTSKRLLASLLAVLTVLSVFATVSSFAAEEEGEAVAAAVETVEVAAEAPAEEVAAEAPAEEVAADLQTEAVAAPEEQETPQEPEQPTVGRVTGLGKTSYETNRISLKWNVTEGASGYAVYICDADKTSVFSKVAEIKQTAVTVTNLRQSTMHYCRVVAYVEKDGKKYYGEPTTLTTATQPVKPAVLMRTRSSSVCEVKWNMNNNATGYKVYRAPLGGSYSLVKTIVGKKNNRYTDTSVKVGTTYTYKVVTYRVLTNGNTYHSAGSTINVLSGLGAPNFAISSHLYKVWLSWNRNPYATRYDIYYSKDPNAIAYTYAGTTTGTSFMTSRMASGQKLYFRVYPICRKNGVTVTGTSDTKAITVSNSMYGTAAGSTYVEVNINQQRMWFYKDGKLMVDTPVVTGTKYYSDTPKGFFSIFQRATNTTLVGPGYASPVDYWMAFSGGCGIHDASWRDTFGGSIYLYSGSHGCVNTPYNAVKTIYNNTGYSTPVIVY